MAKKVQTNEVDEKFAQVAANIIDVPFDSFLEKNYLPYAYYVIQSRALTGPDGLKPVQRRVLYSMWETGLFNNKPPLKAQTISGNTMGAYHPHGDVAISDALARMAQKHSMRVPLIDNHGSVGYFTGDAPAAARYWEARLTKAAEELLTELDNNPLPMGKNFDETLDEPALLPVRWPSSLINGTQGIAVGYASKIFPHNPTEVMDVAIALVKNPELTIDELMEIMPGPDFPTGGEIVGAEDLKQHYLDGRGSFTLRGRYTVSPMTRGRTNVTFYELPYQVSVKEIISKVQKEKKKNNLTEITEVKDLSDRRHGTKAEIILKSGTNPELAIERIFKHTPASASFSLNQTVLLHGSPAQVDIFEVFNEFLTLRRTCMRNSFIDKAEKAMTKYSNNLGLVKVLIDVDETVEIIKNAADSDTARQGLMKRFDVTEDQANYVLSLQLRRLTKADRTQLIEANDALLAEAERLKGILENDELFDLELLAQLEATKEIIKDERRTKISTTTVEDLKENEKNIKKQNAAIERNAKYYLTVYADGSMYKSLETEVPAVKGREIPYLYKMTAHVEDDLFAVLPDGSALRFPSKYIPFDIHTKKDAIGIEGDYIGIGKIADTKKENGMVLVSNQGNIAVLNGKFPSNYEPFTLVSLEENEKLISAFWTNAADKSRNLMIGSSEGLVTAFPLDKLRVSNPGVKTIKGMMISEGYEAVGASIIGTEGKVLNITKNTVKVTDMAEIPVKSRGTKGLILQRVKPNEPMIGLFAAESDTLYVSDKMGNDMFLPAPTPRAKAGMKFPTQGLLMGRKEVAPVTEA